MQFLHTACEVSTMLGLIVQDLQAMLLRQFIQLGMIIQQNWHVFEDTAKESFTQDVQTDVLEQVRQLVKWVEQRSHC
jgi:hypothetical protein